MDHKFFGSFGLYAILSLTTTSVSHAQWLSVGLDSLSPQKVVTLGDNLFVGTWGNGVFRSTNDGLTWVAVNDGLSNLYTPSLAVIDSTLFTATAQVFISRGVFRSTDKGDHWIPVNTGLTDSAIASLATGPAPSDRSYLYAGTYTDGIFRSTDNGDTWSLLWDGIGCAATLATIGPYIFASNYDFSFYSPDTGSTWAGGIPEGAVDWAFTPAPGGGFAAFAGLATGILNWGGLYISMDSGTSWQRTNLQTRNAASLASSGSALFVRSGWFQYDIAVGVQLTTDNGANWTDVTANLPDSGSDGYLSTGKGYLFWGNYIKGLWRRPLSEVVTGVRTAPFGLPEEFGLSQNYPNPFNPGTVIEFRIKQGGFVTLKVYDVLGRVVSTLVSEHLESGVHSREWNAEGIAGGVYYYRIQAGSLSQTRSLVLQK